MKTIGLIVNPIAGMGGKVGLKGTDSKEILNRAIALGAVMEAPSKALEALKKFCPIKDKLLFLTPSSHMGANICESLDFNYEVIYTAKETTDSNDTKNAAKIMKDRDVELIIFVGGDGTARNIYEVVNTDVTVIGIPAGVKIYSPVYANTPKAAGELAFKYLYHVTPTMESEVIDLDEDAFRNNFVSTSLYGYLKIPYLKEYIQNKKAPTPLTEEASQKSIALDIIDNMKDDIFYIIGPGTTTKTIMKELGLPYSLLGVDIVKSRKIIRKDCNEEEILTTIKNCNAKIIVTPTGGQGYLLGRGNQQLSSKVLNLIGKENIIIISTSSKIIALDGAPLRIYTGDYATDSQLSGYFRVKTGYGCELMYNVVSM